TVFARRRTPTDRSRPGSRRLLVGGSFGGGQPARRTAMNPTVAAEVARLNDMSVNQLAQRFEQLFGEECRSRHRRYLIRRIAWRLQANAEGDLTERARQRAEELASDAEIRVTPPRERKAKNDAAPCATIKI